jgi:membrane protein DedA with SNARE-associated domain
VNVSHLVATYGYWALFAIVAGESLGVPVPGETALIVAGAYAGTTHHLSPWIVFLVAALAAIGGSGIGFWIGNLGGYRLVRRYGRKVRLDERKLKIARFLFDNHGTKVVFFARFVTILRTYAAFLAGTSRMDWRRFLTAAVAGGIVWAATYTVAAYLAGATLRPLSLPIDAALIGATSVTIAGSFMLTRRRISKIAGLAEAAYPGPLE